MAIAIRFGTIIVPIVATLLGMIGVSYTSLSGRVDALSAQSAGQQQAITDIDQRLTRIENKLDTVLSTPLAQRVVH